MNKDIKTKWVGALRSGDYYQTKETLYDGNGYCCLGVLCELAVEAGVVELYEGFGEHYYRSNLDAEDENSIELPLAVQKWAGFRSAVPNVGHKSLITLNDEDGRDFNYIADKIEKYL